MKVQVWNNSAIFDLATYINVEEYNLICFKTINYDLLIDKSGYKIGDFEFRPGHNYNQIGYQNKTSSGYVCYQGESIKFYGYFEDYLLFVKPDTDPKQIKIYDAVFFAFKILDSNNLFTLNSAGSGRIIEMKKPAVKPKKTVTPEVQTEKTILDETEKTLSPGTKPYFDKYLNKNKEVCSGGLVFEIGKKPSCKECASSCSGCLEMAVNYGNANIEDVYHLIERPEILNKTNRKKFDSILEKKNKIESTSKTDKNNCNRSSIYYPGQKNIEGVYQKIVNEIPECERFIELFAGTGAISKIVKKYAPKTTVICNDINEAVAGKIKFTGEEVSSVDAITYLKNNITALSTNDFVFLDPPYHPETRPNSLNLYKYELSAQDHEQLISSVLQLKCLVMIIHPGCDLYDDTLIMDNGWRFVDLKIRYHNKTSHERLYMNYQAPKKLLITKFLGKDCWDRQRIKRKGDRIIAKLKSLPAPELQYILEKINNEINL